MSRGHHAPVSNGVVHQEEVEYVPLPTGRTQTALRAFSRESMSVAPAHRQDFAAISAEANKLILQGEPMEQVVDDAMREIQHLRNGGAR